jgi:hypothetical protein
MVAAGIARPLGLPEAAICLRCHRTIPAGVHVPETAMNINDLVQLRKNEIGCAWKISSVETVPVAEPMDNAANDHFGLSIFAPYGRHIPAALLRRVNIHCYFNPFRTARMKASTSNRCTPFTCG